MTTIADKVEHVKAAIGKPHRNHECHWPGCGRQVAPAQWGCREHWYALPAVLRARIWRAYRPGQENDMKPSARYLEVAREVQEWIAGQQRP